MTLRRLARIHGFDLLIVLGAVAMAVEAVARRDELTGPVWFAAPGAALVILPLLGRGRFPFAAPAAVWLIAAALSFAEGQLIPSATAASMGGLAAAYLLGHLRDAAQARVGLAIAVTGAALVAYNEPDHGTGDLIATPLLFLIGWLAGFAMRERADIAEAAETRALQAAREREAAARVAVAEERARIARELHDIVAHAMSVMVLQVGAVRHRLPATGDREALEGVERTGRTALTEMRRLLGAMRRDDEAAELAPQPGLASLDTIVEQVARAGLPTRLHVEGDPFPLPGALDVSAYRIVQEGLTNALKHARARRADVTVRYGADELTIEVRDDGEGDGEARGDGRGHGLVGVRERVKIYGGEMSAGTAGDGGFLLRARLPVRGGA